MRVGDRSNIGVCDNEVFIKLNHTTNTNTRTKPLVYRSSYELV